MDVFTNFLANNYVWFIIISLILIFALIGYLVDKKEIKTGRRRNKKEELKIVDFSSIDQSKSLNQSLKEEDSALNLVDNSKSDEVIEENEVQLEQEEKKDILDKIVDHIEEKEAAKEESNSEDK